MVRRSPGEIVITLSSVEKHYTYNQLGVGYNSTDAEILSAIKPVLLEEEGFDVENADETFTIKRVDSSQNIYVFPKSVAGKAL